MTRFLPIAFLLCSFAQAQDFSTTPAPAPYYQSQYENGGQFQVMRYREQGTVDEQRTAGRQYADQPLADQPAYHEQQLQLAEGVQLLAFRLVSGTQHAFAERTYRTQDESTTIVLKRSGGTEDNAPQPLAEYPQTEELTAAGIPESTEMPVRLYPNPAVGYVQLEVPAGHNLRFRLSDMQGRQIKLQQLADQADSIAVYQLSLDKLQPGTYIYTVEGDNFRSVGRLLVQ
ncbi:MAG: T9SS type A sorting domain-containing protein [Bacteroidetes bacterium]|jgi:hypothetical protein|nr:T9SS type A sorting domain-containing protein [Bacteroidota bacterium]